MWVTDAINAGANAFKWRSCAGDDLSITPMKVTYESDEEFAERKALKAKQDASDLDRSKQLRWEQYLTLRKEFEGDE